jgi:non-homologous end joining protein Ku
MVGGYMAECKKQLRFIYVEGRQERTAILKIEGGMGVVYVLYFPSEVAEIKGVGAPVCKPELLADVSALMNALANTKLPEPEEKRNVVIEQLVEAKLTGKPIPVKMAVVATVQKGKSVEELLKESIAMANAK